MSLSFLLTALVIVLVPGTGALYTVGTGLARGARPAVLAGCARGRSTQIPVAGDHDRGHDQLAEPEADGVGYGVLAAAFRARILARPRLLERLRRPFAVCFAGLSARLALESR